MEAQEQAVDLVVVGEDGARAKGLLPKHLSDYHSYGKKVFAPIDGTVAKIRDVEDDLPIGSVEERRPLGNFVLLHSRDKTLVLAHLKRGSVTVREGDRVALGDAIGCIGNSGNTSEPHLHIHAIDGCVREEDCVMWRGKPIPLIFHSRYLRKGDLVKPAHRRTQGNRI